MKKAILAILISAVTMSYATASAAATPEEKAAYKSTAATAETTYKAARAQCKAATGNPKTVCIAEAKAARTRTTAEAQAKMKNTDGARTKSRAAIAKADFKLAKAKCGSKSGNDKDVCIKEAKTFNVAAKSNAKMEKKVDAARADSSDALRNANYKAASERCDGLASAAKSECTAGAKAQFGK